MARDCWPEYNEVGQEVCAWASRWHPNQSPGSHGLPASSEPTGCDWRLTERSLWSFLCCNIFSIWMLRTGPRPRWEVAYTTVQASLPQVAGPLRKRLDKRWCHWRTPISGTLAPIYLVRNKFQGLLPGTIKDFSRVSSPSRPFTWPIPNLKANYSQNCHSSENE